MDDKGATLFARLANQGFPNASTTKIVTALVVAERADISAEVTVSPQAEAIPGGKLSLYADERWSVEELLKALLMNSSNDAAVALAEHVAGTEDAFVRLMNRKAAELGARETYFVTSHGLDEPGHRSSARDLARFAAELLDVPLLAHIVRSTEAVIEAPGRRAELENTNLLLEGYPGAIGVKTGFTALAGNVLVAAVERRGRRLMSVVMSSEDPFADSRILLDAGFERLRNTLLLADGALLDSIVFDHASTEVVTAGEVRGIHDPDLVGTDLELTDIRLPLAAGDDVGEVQLSVDGRPFRALPAIARSGIDPEPRAGWMVAAMQGLLRTAAAIVPGEDA